MWKLEEAWNDERSFVAENEEGMLQIVRVAGYIYNSQEYQKFFTLQAGSDALKHSFKRISCCIKIVEKHMARSSLTDGSGKRICRMWEKIRV